MLHADHVLVRHRDSLDGPRRARCGERCGIRRCLQCPHSDAPSPSPTSATKISTSRRRAGAPRTATPARGHRAIDLRAAASAALERVSAQFHTRWSRLRDLKLASPREAANIEEAFWADHNAEMLACWGLERHSGKVRRWFNEADLDASALYEDTVPALRALADRGIVMGVYSNRPTPIQATITRLGLARYFLWVGSAGETGFSKPDPRAFTTAAAALGVAPEALVYVGDSVVADVQGARSAGCRPVLLDRSGRHAGEAGCPVIGSLLELPDRVGL